MAGDVEVIGDDVAPPSAADHAAWLKEQRACEEARRLATENDRRRLLALRERYGPARFPWEVVIPWALVMGALAALKTALGG